MPEPLLDVVFVVIGYLSGSLPMGVIVARTTGARDPRSTSRDAAPAVGP